MKTFEKGDIALIRLAFDFQIRRRITMNTELLEALNMLEKEKEISKETLLDAIENSLLN